MEPEGTRPWLGRNTGTSLGAGDALPIAVRHVGGQDQLDRIGMHHVLKRRRAELRLSQDDLASKVGVDKRQIGRWESGANQPTLGVAAELARALGISLDELAGIDAPRRVDLTGDWWACWQSWNRGDEILNPNEMRSGEMKVFDNEALIGFYIATEEAVRSKGSLYFSLHQHGQAATGRWVGLSFDGPIMSGWASLARTREAVERLMDELIEGAR